MTITPTLRVAILRADHPPLSGYGDIFREWMKSGARRKGFPERNLHFQEYDVVEKEEYPKDEDVDAVLVTGSSEFRALRDAETLSTREVDAD